MYSGGQLKSHSMDPSPGEEEPLSSAQLIMDLVRFTARP